MTLSPALRRGLRSWPVLVVLFFTPAAVWAMSNPLLAVSDEPSHVTKAASIWYGQLEGRDTAPGTGRRTYRLPEVWALQPPCYMFHNDLLPNRCPAPVGAGTKVIDVPTNSGAYPPLYFALVGWPGRLFPNAYGVRLMRLVGALLCAAFLAAAVKALQRAVRPGLAVAAVLVAVTPTTVYLSGSVNPSGFEIATAVALWAHLMAMARRAEAGERRVPPALLAGLLVSGVALALTRPLSGPYAGVIVVLALLSVGWPTLRALARQRAVLLSLAALTVVCLIALRLVLGTGMVGGKVEGGLAFPVGANHWTVVMGSTSSYVQQMITSSGWLDIPSSNFVLFFGLGMMFALIGASLMLSRLRQNVALGLTIVATVAIPLVLQAPMTGSASLIWQGRYILPIAVGIPLLAVLGIDRGIGVVADQGRRLAVALAVTVAVLNAYAVFWNLHRYTLGFTDRGLDILRGSWQPPGGSLVWMLVMVAIGVLAVVVVATAPFESPLDHLGDESADPERLADPVDTATSEAGVVVAH